MFMEMARTAAKRSTCFRNNVGVVVVYENRVISIGYNGAPSGEEHCLGNECPLTAAGGCVRSVHAEANALSAIPDADFTYTLSMYCTHSPCLECAELIIRATTKIWTVCYEQEYRITAGKDKLMGNGIHVYRLTPSGYLTDQGTGQLIE